MSASRRGPSPAPKAPAHAGARPPPRPQPARRLPGPIGPRQRRRRPRPERAQVGDEIPGQQLPAAQRGGTGMSRQPRGEISRLGPVVAFQVKDGRAGTGGLDEGAIARLGDHGINAGEQVVETRLGGVKATQVVATCRRTAGNQPAKVLMARPVFELQGKIHAAHGHQQPTLADVQSQLPGEEFAIALPDAGDGRKRDAMRETGHRQAGSEVQKALRRPVGIKNLAMYRGGVRFPPQVMGKQVGPVER